MTDGTGDVPTLDEARAHYAAYLEGLPLKAVAAAILDMVEARGETPFGIGDAHEAAGVALLDSTVVATLTHLSQYRRSPLAMTILFRDADGVQHPVPHDDYASAANGGAYAHPVTGVDVPEPLTMFYLSYAPRPGVLPAAGPVANP